MTRMLRSATRSAAPRVVPLAGVRVDVAVGFPSPDAPLARDLLINNPPDATPVRATRAPVARLRHHDSAPPDLRNPTRPPPALLSRFLRLEIMGRSVHPTVRTGQGRRARTARSGRQGGRQVRRRVDRERRRRRFGRREERRAAQDCRVGRRRAAGERWATGAGRAQGGAQCGAHGQGRQSPSWHRGRASCADAMRLQNLPATFTSTPTTTSKPTDPPLPFNLSLTDSQKAAREEVVLPYLPREDGQVPGLVAGGGIEYVPDEGDDMDDDDPDEDLEV